MDVESLAAELSELKPSEFTAARDEYVAMARKAGDRQLASAIAGLRKPTVAVWTAGLLARRRPKEAQGLVDLGEALRSAHRTLDAEQLRKLSHDQHVVIGELARTARALAVEAGQALSEPVLHEVEQILHAVLADADVAGQWVAGRLTKAPDAASGFTGLEVQPGTAPQRRTQQPAGSPSGHVRPATREPGTDAAAGRADRQRVEAAQAELVEARAEADRLESAVTAAQESVDRAGAAVELGEEAVQAAKEQVESARAERADALARRREAGRAAEKAGTRAKAVARKVEKLTGS
ncbi:hypothetical protein [Streptomyces sp. NBC_01244]|uniref:hypothetical protein n=1 Tax=Streptomyces sp. NBC_01244 TaxID=2903797 RepID=UPI002E162822|nr:hypothetical protein OG247_01690 [Streptomyces sp. NBC_01244]